MFHGRIESELFVTADHQFKIGAAPKSNSDAAYAIRQDMIAIRGGDCTLEPDEVGLTGRYLASEYTGSAFMYFFQIRGGPIVEVENHLSHRAMQDLSANSDYTLTWKAKNALVFG